MAPDPRTEEWQVRGVLLGRGVVHSERVAGVQPVGRGSGPGASSLPPPPPVALVLPDVLALLPPVVRTLVLVAGGARNLFFTDIFTLVLHRAAASPEPDVGAGDPARDGVGGGGGTAAAPRRAAGESGGAQQKQQGAGEQPTLRQNGVQEWEKKKNGTNGFLFVIVGNAVVILGGSGERRKLIEVIGNLVLTKKFNAL